MTLASLQRSFLSPGRQVTGGHRPPLDYPLLVTLLGIALFGAVMVTSASMPYAAQTFGGPFYFAARQSIFLFVAFMVALMVFRVPMSVWERLGPLLLAGSLILLALVLVPGIGKVVNGSRRWIDLGIFNVQVSEGVKILIIIYMAGYLVRRSELVRNTVGGFLNPLFLILAASALLIMEPDFGAAFVIVSISMLMLYVAGARLLQFLALIVGLALVGFVLIRLEPYRWSRFSSFTNPWADPYDTGFQLSQSLIAIGSGSWNGVGLGSSVQKLLYLPEAHTDFVFAIICEELGLMGAVTTIGLFVFLLWRAFSISRAAHRQGNRFSGYVAFGIGSWVGLQAFINIGVNMGLLPTKGITLPMMSYGGSSALIFAVSFTILLRVDYETRQQELVTLSQAGRARSVRDSARQGDTPTRPGSSRAAVVSAGGLQS